MRQVSVCSILIHWEREAAGALLTKVLACSWSLDAVRDGKSTTTTLMIARSSIENASRLPRTLLFSIDIHCSTKSAYLQNSQ